MSVSQLTDSDKDATWDFLSPTFALISAHSREPLDVETKTAGNNIPGFLTSVLSL